MITCRSALSTLAIFFLLHCYSPVSASRSTLLSNDSASSGGGGFRVDLIHPESESSPTRKLGSRADKIRHLITKSHARAKFIASARSLRSSGRGRGRGSGSGSGSGTGSARTQDVETPLTPDGGGYIMKITVGSSGQTFKAIADTGSDLVWVQSDPCSDCSGTIFHPRSSSTYRTMSCSATLCTDLPEAACGSGNSCRYEYEYGSGETEGTFATDTVTLGTTSGGTAKFTGLAFGCGTSNEGFGDAEGLVGLGQGPVSLISQLGNAFDHKFSYCLVDINNPSASSPMFFGDAANLSGSDIQSTPIVPDEEYPSFYILRGTGITIAGSSVGNLDTTIIDSGTTLTYIPGSAYDSLLRRLESLVRLRRVDGSEYGLDLCYDTSANKNYKFPALSLRFQGASLTPPTGNYFLAIDEEGEVTCLAMGSADTIGLPASILGNVMQQGYHILYDRGSSTLSFVQENCASLK